MRPLLLVGATTARGLPPRQTSERLDFAVEVDGAGQPRQGPIPMAAHWPADKGKPRSHRLPSWLIAVAGRPPKVPSRSEGAVGDHSGCKVAPGPAHADAARSATATAIVTVTAGGTATGTGTGA